MKTRGPVAAILLAAARGDDGYVCVGDSDTIEAAIAVLAGAKVDELVVVLGEPAGTLAFQIAAPVTTVRRDAEWQAGLAQGLKNGVRALQPDGVAIIVATTAVGEADARVLRRAMRRYHRGESQLFAFERDGVPSLPVLLDRSHRALLLDVADADLVPSIARHADGCVMVSPTAPSPDTAEFAAE